MEILRRVTLRPFRSGPSFTLTLWATSRRDWRGQTILGYSFTRRENGKTETLFRGEDFAGAPGHADDSDETVGAILDFLLLGPGDTDREYFEKYSARQLEFARSSEREALQIEAYQRYIYPNEG